jgi:hypothetical protein
MDRIRRAKSEVRYPPSQVSTDAFHAGCDRSPPIRRRHLPHFRPQPLLRFACGKDGDVVAVVPSRAAKAEVQELNLVGFAPAPLLVVDLDSMTYVSRRSTIRPGSSCPNRWGRISARRRSNINPGRRITAGGSARSAGRQRDSDQTAQARDIVEKLGDDIG